MKYRTRHKQNNVGIKGGTGNIKSTTRSNRLSIDVWGHNTSPEKTKEITENIAKFLNNDFTAWEYFKLGFKKLYETWIGERLEILSK